MRSSMIMRNEVAANVHIYNPAKVVEIVKSNNNNHPYSDRTTYFIKRSKMATRRLVRASHSPGISCVLINLLPWSQAQNGLLERGRAICENNFQI